MYTLRAKINKLMGFLTFVMALLVSQQSLASTEDVTQRLVQLRAQPELDVATLAGGCFWCTESDFEKLEGVVEAVSGFSGGTEVDPSYKQVSSGKTGHTEVVQIFFDPAVISFEALLQSLWRQMDPTDADGQFVDRGRQYRPAIYYHNEAQRVASLRSMQHLASTGRYTKALAMELAPYKSFYAAEDYHQDYYKNNPLRYGFYRQRSGRDQYLELIWGNDLHLSLSQLEAAAKGVANDSAGVDKQGGFKKPSAQALRQSLTPLQYEVTQEEGTERSFSNEYWDNKQAGIYVDIVSGEALFSSIDKYKSGTGWPSFTRPIDGVSLIERVDKKLWSTRTELRSPVADSHLGHLFADGPEPTGLRYCINSASLRFVPVAELKAQGYAEYVKLFM